VKTLDYLFVDDGPGKPVGIREFIGRRPIACFGNSDGDQAMLQYTTINNPYPSFGLIVHHTMRRDELAATLGIGVVGRFAIGAPPAVPS
jgi:hypothetical protein